MGLPETVVKCYGCGKDLNILNPYLQVAIKAQREVLVTENTNEDLNAESGTVVYLGVKSGRGALKRFHDFACLEQYASKKNGAKAKIELHHEDEVYVPEDNRSPEQLVKDGEMTNKQLAAIDREPAKGGE